MAEAFFQIAHNGRRYELLRCQSALWSIYRKATKWSNTR